MPSLQPNQSMNGAWIEAFKVGTHTDSAGDTRNWTPEAIDAYLSMYDPAKHEAPIRIDHVAPEQRKQGGAAFGWIEAAKREGNTVFVKLKQVSSQFEAWVRQGLVKKRSIAFDHRYGIHHIAFLGYNCPAVPGMENVYSESETYMTIEFNFSESAEQLPADPMKAGQMLAKKAKEFQDSEAAKGREISIATAVAHVSKGMNFSSPMETINQPTARLLNVLNEPINTGNGELLRRAKSAVTEYNQVAAQLAHIVNNLLILKKEINDVGVGVVMKSGSGWIGNALENIPMLAFRDEPFPTAPGSLNCFLNMENARGGSWLSSDNSAYAPGPSYSQIPSLNRKSSEGATEAKELARKIQNFVSAEAASGRFVTFTEAMLHVTNQR